MDNKNIIKKNYLFNVAYQLLLIIVPLITTPYVSRVLLPEGVGQYSFSFSIITYFTIFAALGFNTYAQRAIAKYQDDKYAQTKAFWEIIICRLASVLISLAVNIVLGLFRVYQEYSTLMLIMNINIFAVAFDVAFYFQGNEKFGQIVVLNSIIKISGTVLIFLLVKTQSDVWVYTLINSLIVLFGYLVLWIKLPKNLVKVKFSDLRPFIHLKPTLLLFLPTIAISIYTVLDRTLIGLLITDTYTYIDETGAEIVKKYSDLENGYYEQAEKLVKLSMTIVTCIGTVMIPRNSKEFADGNIAQVKENIYSSSRFVWFLSIPMSLGLICVASNFVPWFYGDGYEKCATLISIFSALIMIIGFSNIFGLQYLIPSGQDKKYTIALVLGALINLTLNLIFIHFWWSIGATIASVIAELAVTVVMALSIRKEISIPKILGMSWKYLIAGGAMFALLFIIKNYFASSILNTVILVVIGIAVYLITLIILREKFIFGFFAKIKHKIGKKESTN